VQIKGNKEAAPYLRDVLLTFGDGVLDLGALADAVVVVEALLLLDEVVSLIRCQITGYQTTY
jgi:hypothetical protein